MTTSNFSKEKISQAIDGDLSRSDLDALVRAADDPVVRAAWLEQHQVGELLRSEETAVQFSAGFNDRLFARLDLEPAHVAGAHLTPLAENVIAMPARVGGQRGRAVRRFVLPGAAAAAVVAVAAIFSAPSLMVAKADKASVNATVAAPAATEALAENHVGVPSILRDPNVDSAIKKHRDPTMVNTGSENFTTTTDYNATKDK